jgi:hypothetical protein
VGEYFLDLVSHPTAFVSYSWDSDGHKEWVAKLATRLRADGIDVKLDQWHLVLGDQLPRFMEKEIQENDFVLIVCTPNYALKSDGRKGGVGYEGDIMTAHVLTNQNHRKFIPVLACGTRKESFPSWLQGKYSADLSNAKSYEAEYKRLWETLTGKSPSAPPLGPKPVPQQPLLNGSALSKEETEILIASQERGELILLRADAFGTWLRAGKADFADNNDKAVQAIYLDALVSLLSKGLARKETSDYFVLTGTGFSVARRLAENAQKDSPKAVISLSTAMINDTRYISKNGLGAEVLIELPRIAYIGEVFPDYNFFAFSVIYQANQGKVDVGGFSSQEDAVREHKKLKDFFQAWANRPL